MILPTTAPLLIVLEKQDSCFADIFPNLDLTIVISCHMTLLLPLELSFG